MILLIRLKHNTLWFCLNFVEMRFDVFDVLLLGTLK